MPPKPKPGFAEQLRAAQRDPMLVEAALALQQGDLSVAERLLKQRLRTDAEDIAALRMLGELAARVGRLKDAQELLEHALRLAPGFTAARLNYAPVLHRRNLLPAARAQRDAGRGDDPANPAAKTLKAAVLAHAGEYGTAIELYEAVLLRYPDQSRLWMSMGHALKTVGRQHDSVAAYRKALSLEPGLGEAWWSLANLKTVRFAPDDLDRMQEAIRHPSSADDLHHLHYALGKAFEDQRQFRVSFEHYATGARLRKAAIPYDPARTTRHLVRSCQLLTRAVFDARAGQGWPDPAPIFIVGLPRSGSTLVEQILASHSQVEGTMELPELGIIARELATASRTRRDRNGSGDYLDGLLASNAATLAALGRRYIDRTRIQRKTNRPLFIDKMPNNFEHLGLIRLILPHARIIDTRRHPMASCFSAFKQHFSRGQSFTYSLDDLAAYYRDYVALMMHYDAVLPGAVHRVCYEKLVRDPETEIHRLLAYCGLDFEQSCLDFHKTDRSVRTASSEQVRQPLNGDAVDHWRHYAPWLGAVQRVLANTIHQYDAELSQ